jgi:hypothetical protein
MLLFSINSDQCRQHALDFNAIDNRPLINGAIALQLELVPFCFFKLFSIESEPVEPLKQLKNRISKQNPTQPLPKFSQVVSRVSNKKVHQPTEVAYTLKVA